MTDYRALCVELVEAWDSYSYADAGDAADRMAEAVEAARAAELLQKRHEPVPVSERLPELRGMFERILCVARSSGQRPAGNIELADRLISAVASWAALLAPAGEVGE